MVGRKNILLGTVTGLAVLLAALASAAPEDGSYTIEITGPEDDEQGIIAAPESQPARRNRSNANPVAASPSVAASQPAVQNGQQYVVAQPQQPVQQYLIQQPNGQYILVQQPIQQVPQQIPQPAAAPAQTPVAAQPADGNGRYSSYNVKHPVQYETISQSHALYNL